MQGNIILTDANYEILTLLRSHRDDAKGVSFMARHAYPIHSIRLRTPLQAGQLTAALEGADDKATLRGRTLCADFVDHITSCMTHHSVCNFAQCSCPVQLGI